MPSGKPGQADLSSEKRIAPARVQREADVPARSAHIIPSDVANVSNSPAGGCHRETETNRKALAEHLRSNWIR